jgi:hypothetical protein
LRGAAIRRIQYASLLSLPTTIHASSLAALAVRIAPPWKLTCPYHAHITAVNLCLRRRKPHHSSLPPWPTTKVLTQTGCQRMRSLSRYIKSNVYKEAWLLTSPQAAAMMSQNHPAAARPPRTTSARPDYNKPPPATPSQRYDPRPDDRYGGGGRGAGVGGGYDSRPPPGAYHDSRYDSRYDARQDHRQDTHHGVGSPPPANYGQGPPPQGYHGRPPIAQQSRPPPTPAPPRDANDREALWRLFGAVDKDSMFGQASFVLGRT